MDYARRHLLQAHRTSIIDDLDVTWIIDELITGKAINSDEAKYLLNLANRRDKVTALLEMLPNNGSKAYDVFVDSLKKDYSWLWKLLYISEDSVVSTQVVEHSFNDSLARGDVPRLPIHYVKRTELENEINTKLTELPRHQMLVLHGMAGSGKSSLAINALRSNSSLVVNTFKGNIFWMNVGDCYTDEQIVALQTRMYRKICTSDFYRDYSSLDAISEMSLNTSVSSSKTYEQGLTDYKDMLKSAFENDNFRDSLIVIDDLRLDRVAQAFDVGCKVMVTTQDTSCLSMFHPVTVNVSESLTESESLELIGCCIDQAVNSLPAQARKIHSLCKGAPLLMALLGGLMADNKERLRHDDTYWNYYVKQLKNKDNFLLSMFRNTSSQQKPYLAISMCIDSLQDKNVITLFKSLAVLPNNVKVPTKALSTILNKSQVEVDDIMKQLKNKSLVIEYYDVDIKSYQYEIHDMIMSYLKSIHNENDMKRLHTSLICRYKEKCLDKNLINLPDDGYIAYYIGYHIEHTEDMDNMWNMFNELYTDLTFIGNKIRLAGPADVTHDFTKYSKHIIKKATDNELISELSKFIHSYAYDLHWYPNTDIIQSIFQHGQKGLLYDKAMSVAAHPDNKNNLYFQFQSENSAEETNYVPLDVRDTICIVKFWKDYILIGNATGKIIMWCLPFNKKVQTFHGHEGAIKSISLDYKLSCKMATIGEDGVLKIWIIRDETDPNGIEEVDSFGIDDPAEDTFESACTLRYDARQPFAGSCWGHVSEILLAHTDPGGSLVIYTSGGEKIKEMKKVDDYSISSSILSLDDSLAICGYVNNKSTSSKYGIHIYNSTTGDFVMSFTENEYVLTLALIKDNPKCILSLTKIHLNKHIWKHSVHMNMTQARSISQVKIADLEVLKAEYTFQTGCVSADGLYMFVSTTDGHVLVYSLKSNEMVLELNNHRGKVTSIDSIGHWDHLEPTHLYSLITKSGEDVHTLKFWYFLSSQLTPPSESKGKVKLSLKFDCVFDKLLLNSPVITDLHYADYTGSPVKRVETLDRHMTDSSNSSPKVIVQKTVSLDRQSMRPLKLRNISNLDIPSHPIIAVVDKKNKVQVLKGKKCVIETPPTKSTITTVALSQCGQYLTYGTKEGVVNLLFLMSRSPKKIMDLNDEIHYLEFVSDKLLVAASRSGGLMIYELMGFEESFAKMIVKSGVELGSQELINDFNGKRNKNPSDSSDRIKQPSPSSVSSLNMAEYNGNNITRTYPSTESNLYKQTVFVKCFWLEDAGLLSVACDGSVKRWNLEPRVLGIVVRKQSYFRVTCAALYKKIFMVLCDDTGKFQIYSLVSETSDKLSGLMYDSNQVKGGVTCCAISSDGKLLALGLESGTISLWNISNKAIITTLSLHKTRVRYLKFSPGPPLISEVVPVPPHSPFSSKTFSFSSLNSPGSPCQEAPSMESKPPLVLVSLAGQIAWWDITHVMCSKPQNKRKSKLGSTYHLVSPKSNSTMDFDNANNTSAQWEHLWKGKRAKKNSIQEEILSCIKLVGDEAHQVLTDEKFSKFVTVDQSGNLYVMDVMDNCPTVRNSNTNGNGHTS